MNRFPESEFSNALRLVRKAKGFTQEDFEGVASRVHISALERRKQKPTLRTVDALANHLEVHPLTLLVLAYSRKPASEDVRQLLGRVLAEIEALPLGVQET